MGSIRSSIELQDNFTNILMNVINVVNMSVSTMEQMQSVMNEPVDTSAINGMRDQLTQAALAAQELGAALQDMGAADSTSVPVVDQPAPVEVPVVWQSDRLEVFTNTGIERFEMEVQSTNNLLQQLSTTQDAIVRRAYNANIFPPEAFQNLNSMAVRIDNIRDHIQMIESNPLNMGTDTANNELEQLRAQLDQAVQLQEIMNQAVQDMDVQAANEAYLRLSQIISGTERHIRDNTDEQGRLDDAIRQSTDSAEGLRNMIAGAVSAFVGMAGLSKAKSWIEDCTAAFNTQLNAETQLISVLANMLDADYVAQFEADVGADTTAAVNEINAIQNGVNEIVVPVTAEEKALTAAYDQITAKASEVQGRGIYGDEIMIAGAAEFATYFSDTDAVTMMMDTLSNYAVGMSGGGALDSSAMVGYATDLGKIMSGSYGAMTKKGFEFTDAQKAIVEGEATREQIVSALGEEYLDMSADMQAAAAISQVIDEAWGGLYETMSNTPEGKIIQMNNTWGDMMEVVGKQLYPYVLLFVDAITENWGTIQVVLDTITLGLQYMLGFFSWLVEGAINFAQVIIDNWGWISPLIYGIIGALAVYGGYLVITKGLELASAAAKGAMAVAEFIHVAALAAQTGATISATAAQMGLNGAMYACPIVWIIVLIVALIAVIFAVCNAIAKTTGVANSGLGVICGALMTAAAFIMNTVIGVINAIIQTVWTHFVSPFISIIEFVLNVTNGGFDSFGGAVANLIGQIISWFLSLGEVVTKIIDAIFGTDWTSGLNELQSQVLEWGKNDNAITLDRTAPVIDTRFDYSNAWEVGSSWGDGIAESISNFDPALLFDIMDIPSADDYAGALTAGGIGTGIEDISGNTGAMADAMDITSEELKYLRDMAEQETVNRFTTARITIEQTNHNTVKSGMDLDGIVSGLTDAVSEAVENMAEGVHM